MIEWQPTPIGVAAYVGNWDLAVWDSDYGGYYWKATFWGQPTWRGREERKIDGWGETIEKAKALAIAAMVI